MISVKRAVAGTVAGLACAGALLTGGQAFAATAPAATVVSQATTSGTLTGSLTAILSDVVIVKVAGGGCVSVHLNQDTKIQGRLSLSGKVTVHTVEIDGKLYASLIVIG